MRLTGLMFTFGHGRATAGELGTLLRGAGVRGIVDIRRYPGSRANPAASGEALRQLAEDLGISYRWEERLGGRRHLTAEQLADSPDTWWRVPAFRAYAGWTRSEQFHEAMSELLSDDGAADVAVMCSESVWWRCHRRLVADVALAIHGEPVTHILPGGRLSSHELSPGARIAPHDQLVWDLDPGARP